MMFFLQNQTVLSSLIVLNMDMIFLEPMLTKPIHLYTIILTAFTSGAILILLIFIWERLSLSRQLSSSKKKILQLEKSLEKLHEELSASEETHLNKSKLREELNLIETHAAEALRDTQSPY